MNRREKIFPRQLRNLFKEIPKQKKQVYWKTCALHRGSLKGCERRQSEHMAFLTGILLCEMRLQGISWKGKEGAKDIPTSAVYVLKRFLYKQNVQLIGTARTNAKENSQEDLWSTKWVYPFSTAYRQSKGGRIRKH